MNSTRLKLVTLLVVFVALIAFAAVRWWGWHERGLKIPDEKKAGVALLAEKLTGPGYFRETREPAEAPSDEDGPWISPQDAMDQLDRVVRERKFDAARAKKAGDLIAKLTEPHPSRVVGGERIHLVRLNLALDQIKE